VETEGVRFHFLTPVSMKKTPLLNVAQCSLVEVNRRFRDSYWFYRQSDEQIIITDRPEDGGSTHLWNVSLRPQDYTGLHPRKLSLSCSQEDTGFARV
jgi:hypothetical protein